MGIDWDGMELPVARLSPSFGRALIEIRPLSNDSAGQSPKPKRRPKVRPPTDSEFAAVDAAQQIQIACVHAVGDRNGEICRISNHGLWATRIDRAVDCLPDDEESLAQRRIAWIPQAAVALQRQRRDRPAIREAVP
ncbi:hypothetical protein NLM33_48765 (plasmid) [Bradyrhizobium sp. CCGUVB1N3]|uniref:hypothetical protein n=1 Tax=Bradyrhizobium sp. CCGUVB1N3 TaxID=2949629 RepID=UPI0020B2AA04|nr:hypothetical protein [Bradyrhizobium sp. CCGUVB1N3]MCP3477967.1 hypothetical protein [Bradyrhizobium sp. CCGUVB1N3]